MNEHDANMIGKRYGTVGLRYEDIASAFERQQRAIDEAVEVAETHPDHERRRLAEDRALELHAETVGMRALLQQCGLDHLTHLRAWTIQHFPLRATLLVLRGTGMSEDQARDYVRWWFEAK